MPYNRYRFFSDTNLRDFEDDLFRLGASFSTSGDQVTLRGYVPDEIARLASDLGAQLVSDDLDYTSTSGLDGPGFHDMQSTALRANPPDIIRGQAVPDYAKQIVSQQPGKLPARRKTRSQP